MANTSRQKWDTYSTLECAKPNWDWANVKVGLDQDWGQHGVIRTPVPLVYSHPVSLPFTPPHLFWCLSSQSILLLPPIVFFFFCYLILLSSFSPLLRGAALLSIFVMRPGKKADGNRTERSSHSTPHNRHTVNPVTSPPVLPCFSSLLFCLIFLHL